jgi:TolA-binding protein
VSEETAPAQQVKGGIERHIQTLVTSITLALLMWTGLTLVDLRDRLARMEEKIISLNADLTRAQADRFTMTDWKREKENLEERFRRLEREDEYYRRGGKYVPPR